MDAWKTWIKNASAVEIDELLDAALERRRELFPQWDMLYIALPKNDNDERQRIGKELLKYI